MPDHVHMLVEIHPSITVSDFVREVKISTNSWMKQHQQEFPDFDSWGKAYCALTYSKQDMDRIKDYISNQKKHHETVSLRDEYEQLLKEFNIEPDQWLMMD